MARKQLIKGANAARVEERISRVPADIGARPGEAGSIFGALRAMESGEERRAAKVAAAPAAKPAIGGAAPKFAGGGKKPAAKPSAAGTKPAAKRLAPVPAKSGSEGRSLPAVAAKGSAKFRVAPQAPAARGAKAPPQQSPDKKPAPTRTPTRAPAGARPKPSSLRPSDFSAAERREILHCCLDYRNRLPTYLLSARKEVEVLDSIIEKCGGELP